MKKEDKAEQIIRMMFNHFSPKREKLKHYKIRKEFIETFTPVIKSLNESYSYIVENSHIIKYGFNFLSTIYFKNYEKTYIDKDSNILDFNFKTCQMSITNPNEDDFIILKKAHVPNLLTFETIMNSLGFKQN